jgi:hypothetical protein
MSASTGPTADWIQAWIDGQKAVLDQWSASRPPGPAAGKSFANAFAPAFAAAQSAFGAGASVGMPFGFPWVSQGAPGTVPAASAWEMPGVGPLREHQGEARAMAAALADFERLSRDMAAVIARVHLDTLDLLARRAQERANEGKPVGNTQALYDLWVECGEATYAKVAHGEAYCRLQADLCNAGIRVQRAQRQQTERWLKLLDLPTRAEVNTLNQRIRELQGRLDAIATPPSSKPGKVAKSPRRKAARATRKPRARP